MPTAGFVSGPVRQRVLARALEADFEDQTEDDITARFDENEFVTEYAATNPGEDLAEVFAEWVYADETSDGDRIVDQKMRFFDQFPELVAVHEHLREVLGFTLVDV